MIIVIDDKAIFRNRWIRKLKKTCSEVIGFSHPKEFLKALESGVIKPSLISMLIVDRKNGKFDALKEDFANSFRYLYQDFKGNIILSSALHTEFEGPKKGYDTVTNKHAKTLEELIQLINKGAQCDV